MVPRLIQSISSEVHLWIFVVFSSGNHPSRWTGDLYLKIRLVIFANYRTMKFFKRVFYDFFQSWWFFVFCWFFWCLVFANHPTLHSVGSYQRRGSVAVADWVSERWQVAGDRWQGTRNMWHMTHYVWHMTHDIIFTESAWRRLCLVASMSCLCVHSRVIVD